MGMKTENQLGRRRGRRGSDHDWKESWRLNAVGRVITYRLHLRRISTGDGSGTGDWQGTEGNRKWQVKTHRKLNRLETRKKQKIKKQQGSLQTHANVTKYNLILSVIYQTRATRFSFVWNQTTLGILCNICISQWKFYITLPEWVCTI